ncbi:Tex family protein [Frankia nepalensis]|uniref:RNA-binding transcriptional accessory protein n=1 Tax=Frankia nepalensis TaxID=1836974 RepID=A0A937UM43_9ACTN|nr:Tex family protein [Frankia nepalensis]MBL7497220.1 RNA-binding transcriptional accessory protein [Frankia nepalensis]MBL7510345.1 RNA-binding transcriptional accessory protein [Frankia nepalensis]MBL7626683.1 RNA-binding transcriptional accessory protein [Frankia nepalensis]
MTTTSTAQAPQLAVHRSIEARIAEELGVRATQVSAAVELLDGGSTVPFIARYRKEVTGTLDDAQLRTLEERLRYLRELEERRAAILESIRSQGKLDDALEAQINAADSKARLEDIYLPYKPKRRTKAQIAREAGLEPLADALLADPALDPAATAAGYVNPEAGVADAPAALDGARAILVERFAEDADLIGDLRERMWSCGRMVSKVREGKEEAGAKFADYFAFDEPFTSLPSHRILALFRGEKEEVLDLDLDPEPEDADPTALAGPSAYETRIAARFGVADQGRPADRWLSDTVRWAWRTRVLVHLGIDLRLRLFQAAEDEAVRVFAANLRDLLLAAPAGARSTMGLDPGYRTGVKVAVVDATGKVVATDTIYPHVPARRWDEALAKLGALCAAHQVDLIAIGNGTASRETDKLAEELVRRAPELKLTKIVVSEAGASVYSASAYASRELPGMDVSLRGAVSIARRLQDPLAELVKIDPKSIGVGQYQHDVSELKLSRSLDAVVEDCVNAVGVDVNTASAPLLTRVSGIGATLAENIVAHRDATGPFRTRAALREVPRLGPKAFEQCAGFLRIPGGDDPLDASSVHPEAYPVVRRILTSTSTDLGGLIGNAGVLRAVKATDFVDEKFGLPTVSDILAELEKPGRDPRPAFKTATFAEGVHELSDLVAGMVLEGVVTNVAAFGAFVDVGVHQDGLVHVSAMSKNFVRDPREVAKPGDIVKVKVLDVDIPRKRISLTLRLDDESTAGAATGGGREGRGRPAGRDGRQDGGGQPVGRANGTREGGGRDGGGRGGGRDSGGRGGDGRRRDAAPAGAGAGPNNSRGGSGDSRGGSGPRGGGRGQRGGGRGAPPPTGAIADALRRAGLVDENGVPRTGR